MAGLGNLADGLRVEAAGPAAVITLDRPETRNAMTRAMWIALPQASRGMVAAVTIAWARALGEFGPILVFAGATRMRTEVLSTTVFLELSIGNLNAAVAVSLLMVAMATLVLVVLRSLGTGVTT